MNRDKKKSRQQRKKRREGCRNTTTSCFILLIRWVWCTCSSIDWRMKVTQGYVAPQRANSFWRTVGHQIIAVCNPCHDTRRMVSFAAQRVLIFGEPTMTPPASPPQPSLHGSKLISQYDNKDKGLGHLSSIRRPPRVLQVSQYLLPTLHGCNPKPWLSTSQSSLCLLHF